MPQIPPAFAKHMAVVHGEVGKNWIEGLPEVLNEFSRRWGITIHAPFGLSWNYVTPATRRDGQEVVFKIGIPNLEFTTELAALRHYQGEGIAILLDADPEAGAMLLERVTPGDELVSIKNDETATRIAARVMARLWKPPPSEHAFPTTAQWADGLSRHRNRFGGGTRPIDPPIFEIAEDLFAQLLASEAVPVLLHGDLHHYNILAATRQPWLAIDPKGVVGEPAYETGSLLRNPLFLDKYSDDDLAQIQHRRVAILSEMLGFDKTRILAWGVAQAVLSAVWSIEDNQDGWEGVVRIGTILHNLLNRGKKI